MEPYTGDISGLCGQCGGELYNGELCYRIDGQDICQSCLRDYAAQFFAPCLVQADHVPQ